MNNISLGEEIFVLFFEIYSFILYFNLKITFLFLSFKPNTHLSNFFPCTSILIRTAC